MENPIFNVAIFLQARQAHLYDLSPLQRNIQYEIPFKNISHLQLWQLIWSVE